jgi:hypothetical protein
MAATMAITITIGKAAMTARSINAAKTTLRAAINTLAPVDISLALSLKIPLPRLSLHGEADQHPDHQASQEQDDRRGGRYHVDPRDRLVVDLFSSRARFRLAFAFRRSLRLLPLFSLSLSLSLSVAVDLSIDFDFLDRRSSSLSMRALSLARSRFAPTSTPRRLSSRASCSFGPRLCRSRSISAACARNSSLRYTPRLIRL